MGLADPCGCRLGTQSILTVRVACPLNRSLALLAQEPAPVALKEEAISMWQVAREAQIGSSGSLKLPAHSDTMLTCEPDGA